MNICVHSQLQAVKSFIIFWCRHPMKHDNCSGTVDLPSHHNHHRRQSTAQYNGGGREASGSFHFRRNSLHTMKYQRRALRVESMVVRGEDLRDHRQAFINRPSAKIEDPPEIGGRRQRRQLRMHHYNCTVQDSSEHITRCSW